MKYSQLFLLIVLFNFNNTIGQISKIPQKGNHFLFTLKEQTYLLENDSIYNVTSKQRGFPKPHGLEMKEYKFLSKGSKGYMKNSSSGIVYAFDGDSFKRLDHSFDFKSQFRSFSFFHDNLILDFGGYGLHTFKNTITYFNFGKKETEVFTQITPLKDTPEPRDRMMAQYDEETLYIGPGHGIPLEVTNPYENAGMITDYWQFSFDNKTWHKLGEGTINANYPYDFVYDFKEHPLLISENGVYECDIKNNILITYPYANLSIVKSLNKNNTLSAISYNKAQKGFYMIIDKPLAKAEVLFVKTEDFLGTKKVIGPLYTKQSNWYFYAIGILVIVLVSGLVYFRRKKSVAQLIKSKNLEIQEELKIEDYRVLNKLLEAYPDYINYSELLDMFPDYLGYESKKKKIRQSILTIEEYLIHKLKINVPVFTFRKNIEDKREKQIRIR